jgi:hypothetical protein
MGRGAIRAPLFAAQCLRPQAITAVSVTGLSTLTVVKFTYYTVFECFLVAVTYRAIRGPGSKKRAHSRARGSGSGNHFA